MPMFTARFSFLLLLLSFVIASTIIPHSALASLHAEEEQFRLLQSGKRVPVELEYRDKPAQKTVYLTFDDGPSEWTDQALDVLREHGVKATFFVLGELAERRPETVRRIAADGHALGNHTWNHKYEELYNRFEGFWEQLIRTEQTIERVAGVKTKLVRAPGGSFSNFDPFYYYYLETAGYRVHDWNVDSGDSRRRGVPASEILENVKRTPLQHEMNVLLHDSAGHGESIAALPDIIGYFKEQGYRFAALDDSVKPIQFRGNGGKTGRTYELSAFHAAVERSVLARADERKSAGPQLAGRPDSDSRSVTTAVYAESEAAPRPERTLTLQLGGKQLELQKGRAELRDDRLYVPVRALAEWLGGEASWSAEERTAVVRLGTDTYRYQAGDGNLSVQTAMGSAIYEAADFELRDGITWVPLRRTIEQWGLRVATYTLEPTSAHVELKLPQAVLYPFVRK